MSQQQPEQLQIKKGMLEDAIVLAAARHRGQKDRGKEPYILHPLRVMAKMRTSEEKIVAVLHDVVEDTSLTIEDLRALGFSPRVVEAVQAMTHFDGESYESYIERIGRNVIARAVKLADLEDNMNLTRIKGELKPKDFERVAKYHIARKRLMEIIAADQSNG